MRILILTHPRSGGFSLLTWIFNEKKKSLNFLDKKKEIQIYHEPDLTNEEIKKTILNRDNIVVKLFLSAINSNELNNFMDSFDKVIIHKRDDITDVAISFLHSNLLNDKIGENSYTITEQHNVYELNNQWIQEHFNEIEYYKKIIKNHHNELDSIIYPNSIRTSYDLIHYDKTDVAKICEYLDIFEPKYLDIIDKTRRLKNGSKGMDDKLLGVPNYFLKKNLI